MTPSQGRSSQDIEDKWDRLSQVGAGQVKSGLVKSGQLNLDQVKKFWAQNIF